MRDTFLKNTPKEKLLDKKSFLWYNKTRKNHLSYLFYILSYCLYRKSTYTNSMRDDF